MDKPLSTDIAEQVVNAMPVMDDGDMDPRLLPGFHVSLCWGLFRFDFNQTGGPASIIQMGGTILAGGDEA